MSKIFAVLLGVSLVAPASARDRIATAGANVTETVFALGSGDRVVGVDTSSVFPDATEGLPKIGYGRQLSAEGILSLRPSLLLCTDEAGPPAVLRQIENAGVRVVQVPAAHDVEGAIARIRQIGEILGVQEKAQVLAESVKNEISKSTQRIALAKDRPSVLFIYARAGGTLNASGTGTGAHAMIELAGGRNAITAYEGYKPLTAESVLAAEPDLILLTSRGLEDLGGIDGLLKAPGLAHTPAGKNRRIVAMDDLLLLSFGPRLGQAIRELGEQFHPSTSQLSAQSIKNAP